MNVAVMASNLGPDERREAQLILQHIPKDFLPMKCDACSRVFCKDHVQYSEHNCDAAYQKDVQVPVCPLCNKLIPVKRGEPPDIRVSQHIDTDCQSDPAKEKRRVFSNKCSLKGCKQKELIPVLCSSCHQNYCLRHRHTTDHDCKGFQNSGRAVSRQAAAAINRASVSGIAGSKKPQETTLSSIGKNLERERRERLVGRQQTTLKDQHGIPQPSASFQAGLSEDEAMRRAIQMSLTEEQASKQSNSQQQDQEAADLALAQALQESEREERQQQRQQQSNSKVDDNVRVVVRCRPLNEKEVSQGFKSIVNVDEMRGTVQVQNPAAPRGEPPKSFTFDTVFAPGSKQTDVYNQTARPIVDAVMEGYNGTIFAYGQTGTGKTFTMEGVRSQPELRGIIPNSFAHIFGQIAKAGESVRFLVRVSYLEIYNEEVKDLLGKDLSARLEVKERPDIGVYVKDLSAFVVNNADDMDRITTLGNSHRSVGSTNMNEHSSRSHAIFSITVERSDEGPDKKQHVRAGKLHMVDLAGSERQSKTGATGQRLKEATKINLSLSTLGNVISSLVDGKSTHIPYRNSKLTRLLQDSLGGNAKTVMCANIGPAEYNYDETISTLRYANRAKNIKNNAHINEDPKDALLRQFQKEIEELKKRLERGEGVGSESDGSEEESGSDGEGEGGSGERHSKRKKGKRNLSPEKMAAMQKRIDEERRALEEKKDMEEEERNKVQTELERREVDLHKAQHEHDVLKDKLKAVEKKVIVGGVDLLKKSEEQERLLEESARELEERSRKQESLRQELADKEAERVDIEEKFGNLQEEAVGKTKKLKKVWSMLMSAKSEVADLQQEHQREMEGLLENIRQLSRELRLQMLIIDSFIPVEFQQMIEQYVHWNEDIGEWQLKCVAYTGNNMRKQTPIPDKDKSKEYGEPDLSNVYLAYTAEGAARGFTKMKATSSRRPKTASGRPKTGKRKQGNVDSSIDSLLQ